MRDSNRLLSRLLPLGQALVVTASLTLALSACPDPTGPVPVPGDTIGADGTADGTGDVPVGDTPLTDTPLTDTPLTDTPLTDTPVTDVPGTDTPVADVPVTDTPGADTPTEVVQPTGCTPLTPTGSGTCSVTAGDANKMLIEGDVMLPTGIQTAGQVLVVDGVITCVGCDCAAQADAATATRITCAEGLISPGLINAHDHITWAQDTPKDPGSIRYDHRHEWRKGLNGKPKITTYQNSHALGDAWGEMRQVLGGTTSLFGSGGQAGFLRNLDKGNLLEGINHADADYSTFPMGDSSGTLIASGCSGYNPDDPTTAANEVAYAPHMSEGIIAAAQNEFACASGASGPAGAVDFVNPNTAFIHGIGVTTGDIGYMAAEGTALIWSPRSNTALYGMTANVPVYDRLGAIVALGTDWAPSGSIHILRELACAQDWNSRWENHFSDADLVAMVTHNAAEALGFGDILGSLVAGKVADIAIWDTSTNKGYRAILDAESSDIALVMRGGLPLFGDAALLEATTTAGDCETIDVCGASKRLCTERELGTTVPALETDLGNFTYGLVFCGVPSDEPSCVPFRPGEFDGISAADDNDGDGVTNANDNCPDTFNAVRPMDGNVQNDADSDLVGDECDPCPFDADTTACSSIDPNDIDGDGVAIPGDNCPSIANADQADEDEDGTGDVCDACPTFKNPGGGPCPGTIYDVKTGVIAPGSGVLLPNAIVTAVGYNFFVLQVDPNVTPYPGVENSGLYVYAGDGPFPVEGDRIEVSGVVAEFFGQIQLQPTSFSVTEAGVGAPAPTVIATTELVTGIGTNAAAYEGVLVTVENVTVTDIAPTGDTGETVEGEFEVTGDLPVDDTAYLIDPFVADGQDIPAITGFVRHSWGRNKLNPRYAADYSLGAPYLLAFGPDNAVVYDQQAGVPLIPAVTVTLNTAPDAPLFIKIDSDNAAISVDGGGVTIAAGELSGAVLVTTTAPAASATLTATLDTNVLSVTVAVLDLATAPAVVSLETSGTVPVDSAVDLTVTLDIPAPPGGQVVDITTTGVAVTVAPTVTVSAGEFTAGLIVTTGAALGTVTVTAAIGASSQDAVLDVAAVQLYGLMLVEVLYDIAGVSDGDHEWVKIYNGTGAAVDLSGYSLGYGGTSYTYGTYQLSGTIPADGCFIVGGPTSDANSFNITLDQSMDFNPDIQNSGEGTDAADALGLFDVAAASITASTVPIDAVVYGPVNSNNLIGTDGLVGEPDVLDSGAGSTLIRTGVDTWAIHSTPDSLGCIKIQ